LHHTTILRGLRRINTYNVALANFLSIFVFNARELHQKKIAILVEDANSEHTAEHATIGIYTDTLPNCPR
jgi:hypothetical protein